jgi:hypothetical protein
MRLNYLERPQSVFALQKALADWARKSLGHQARGRSPTPWAPA